MPLRVVESGRNGQERELGHQAFAEGRWQEAAELLETALQSDPNDAETMTVLAQAYDALGDSKKARTTMGRAAGIAPDSPEIHRGLAVLLSNDGRVMEAVDSACRAVELDPSDMEAVDVLEQVRAQLRSVKPVSKKKGRKNHASGHSQADIDSRLTRASKALRKAARPSDLDSAQDRPTISLCMIARNEEEFITRCIESVKGVVDEVIVLDTGSDDRTVEIAQSLGATVHISEWKDSFSVARNESISHAGCDWILVLDADEHLDATSRKLLLRTVMRSDTDAYALYFRNYTSPGSEADYFVHRACRLFRNYQDYRYVGRVHERIDTSITEAGGKVQSLDALVHHYGYRPEIMDSRQKLERYLKLLHAELAENPTDPFCLYNLGEAYLTQEKWEEAARYLSQAADQALPEHEFAAAAYSRLAKALCAVNRANEALDMLERAERKGIRHPEIDFARGNACLLINQSDQAIAEFNAAIQRGRSGRWIGDPGAYGYKANYGIAQAYITLGDYAKAVSVCKHVVMERPDDAEAHQLLGDAYLHLNRPADAEKHIMKSLGLRPSHPETIMLLADLYQQQNRSVEAKSHYLGLLSSGMETPELRFRYGTCLHASGELEEAEKNYITAIRLKEDYIQAHTALGLLYSQQGRIEDGLNCFTRAIEIDPQFAEAYFGAGDLLYSAGNYKSAADVYHNGLIQDSSSAQGFLSLGNCYFRMMAHDAAVLAYRQALVIRPNYPEARSNLLLAEQAIKARNAA